MVPAVTFSRRGSDARGYLPTTRHYWTLSLLVLPALTLFGNILVCLSVYIERSLHTVTNYFIVSLAVADIMVAVLVMPPAVYVEVRPHRSERDNASFTSGELN